MGTQIRGLAALLAAHCLLAAPGQIAAGSPTQSIDPAATIRACDANAAVCESAPLPQDRTVVLDNHVKSLESYEWLRSGLQQMKKMSPADRHRRAEVLLHHLDETQPATSTAAGPRVRHEADAVLSNVEFAKAKPSWLQRQWEHFQDWLSRHTRLPGAATSSLLRFLLELLLFAVPLVSLGLWLLRQVREERLRTAEPGGHEPREARRRVDWLQAAKDLAEQRQWRDAVHALYWHSISMLEQQRAIAPSHTRTPREYLHLLPSGTTRRTHLRELTLLLETTWYGNGNATEMDYRRAEELVRDVATA
ncbi:MAG: DUF4129 domain-containing protein [Janthinobacterium lividum]